MSKKNYQICAMQAIFDFCEAMDKGELSIEDLKEIMNASVKDGHDMLAIMLSMASIAASDFASKEVAV